MSADQDTLLAASIFIAHDAKVWDDIWHNDCEQHGPSQSALTRYRVARALDHLRWEQAVPTARGLTYWQRIDAEAAAIDVPTLCYAKVPGGMCVLGRGHDGRCSNERTVVRT